MKAKKHGKPALIFKTDLSSLEFELMANSYKLEDFKESAYFYLDNNTTDLGSVSLYKMGVRLRIRVKEGRYSLELKDSVYKKQIIQKIGEKKLNLLLSGVIPKGRVRKEMKKLEIDLSKKVFLVSVSRTIRAKKFFLNGILVIDKTTSLGRNTYQFEFRSDNPKDRTLVFEDIEKKMGMNLGNHHVSKIDLIWARL